VSRKFALVANPAAGGKALEALDMVREELDRLRAEYRVMETQSAGHVTEQSAAAAEAGETVVAIGGDGLVARVAGALRGTTAAIAIVPAGRGNDLARVLEIPSNQREAALLAVEGIEREIDMATANGTPYVGIASLGFDSDANRIANEAKLVRGNLVYLYAALRALAGWKHAKFEVTVDGERHEVTGYSVAVANSKAYGGGMYLMPHAELDDGKLDIFMKAKEPKLRSLLELGKVFKGTHLDNPSVTVLKGERIHIDADRPFDVYADGDPVAQLPVDIAVEPRALRVIVAAS
jgi:YegS/Rv2252/BmrU family lipid kinase